MRRPRFYMRAAALLVALACAVSGAAEAAPARSQGRSASGAAAARPPARRQLRGIEASIHPAEASNVTTKGLAEDVDSILTAFGNVITVGVENAREHVTGQCNWGNWCGAGCKGKEGDPIDELDGHCKDHDYCLSIETDACLRCRCHALLVRDIKQTLDDKGCTGDSWAGDACQSDAAVKESPTIAIAIQALMGVDDCGKYDWGNNCPSEPQSSDYSEEVMYSYDISLKTSCDSGAGTDGSVKIRFEDSSGASVKSGELDNFGNDRGTCAADEYTLGPYQTKVLLNSDTNCQVYFKPKWLFPDWRPEYVRIARRTDNEETKSARFCRDGWLKEEGWYTFYHCS